MLAHLYAPKRFTTPAYVQPKLDGVRALYSAGKFYSRDGIQWAPNVVSHLTEALRHVDPKVVLDGEMYVHGWPLQRINSAVAVKRVAPTAETASVQYHSFDLVSDEPFITRLTRVCDLIEDTAPCIQPVLCRQVHTPEDLENYFVMHREKGYEGTMLRLGTQGYTSPGQNADQDNRTWTMLKRKGWLDGWFECVGAIEGEGKHMGRLGALTLWSETKKYFEVGTGFSDIERERLWEQYGHGTLPSKVKIQYRYLSADGIPCHTSFIETDD